MELITKNTGNVYPIFLSTRSNLKTFNFYLIKDENALTLIDAGINTEKCWDFFIVSLEEHGFSLNDLNQILITHNHVDHVGLIDRIVSVKNIPVHAPKNSIYRLKRDRDYFLMRIEFFRKLYDEMGCGSYGTRQINKLEAALQKHEERKIKAAILPINDEMLPNLQTIHTPGHSPDHVVFWDDYNKWLFSGDLLLKHILSNAIVEPNRKGERLLTLVDYEISLKKCLDLNAEVVFPGHGEIIYNHNQLVELRLKGIKRKASRILKYIEAGHSTANIIAQSLYKDKYESEFSLVMSEIIGHLDYLEHYGHVEKELKEGIWHYFITSTS